MKQRYFILCAELTSTNLCWNCNDGCYKLANDDDGTGTESASSNVFFYLL